MRIGTLLLMAVCLTTACQRGDARVRTMRYYSKSYSFIIEPEQAPPHAREPILYKVFIRDRESRQPIENGEGQIYANTAEMARTWDGFTYGPQLGTYYGKLNFVTSGQWAVGIRFRRDSLHKLESIEWMQDVLNERPPSTP